MKFPSIIRTPRHQRFHVEPRYYDPAKEEFKQREDRIKRAVLAGKSEKTKFNEEENGSYSSLHGAFSKRRSTKSASASITQLLIMVLLTGLIFGYMFFGDVALYVVLAISSVLLYFKITRRS